MNTRYLTITYKNKRSGWTRRARWYQSWGDDEPKGPLDSIRICFEDETGKFNRIYKEEVKAQNAWDKFKAGLPAEAASQL